MISASDSQISRSLSDCDTQDQAKDNAMAGVHFSIPNCVPSSKACLLDVLRLDTFMPIEVLQRDGNAQTTYIICQELSRLPILVAVPLVLLGSTLFLVLKTATVQVLLLTTAAALVLVHASRIKSEAVTVVHGVGLILESRSALGGTTQVFYDQEEVADVLIVEALTTVDVITYLALVLHTSTRLAVAFPSLRPRLQDLKSVYPELHAQVVGSNTAT